MAVGSMVFGFDGSETSYRSFAMGHAANEALSTAQDPPGSLGQTP